MSIEKSSDLPSKERATEMSAIEDTRDIYQRAIDAFGEEHQIGKAIEECAEFIVEVSKKTDWVAFSGWYGIIDANNVAERVIDEIADVTIMMKQMRLMFGKDVVDNRIAFKLERLEQLIADAGDK